jgi:hypothetical protein
MAASLGVAHLAVIALKLGPPAPGRQACEDLLA